jgi:hypothetical protein
VETDAEGCGGAYEAYVDRALDILLALPAEAGANSTELRGNLYTGRACDAQRNAESGFTVKKESATVRKWEHQEEAGKITNAQRQEKEEAYEYNYFERSEYDGISCTRNPATK